MDDVSRFFRALVTHLAEHDPRRLSAPFQISELYQSLIPYRLFKSELQFDSMEDYEMAILRLLAGEHHLVVLDPPDIQDVLRSEAHAVVPDTAAFRDFAGALMALRADAVRAVLDDGSAYAPLGYTAEAAAPERNPRETPGALVSPPKPDLATFKADRGERDVDPFPTMSDQKARETVPPAPADRSSSLVFEAVEAPVTCPSCNRALPEERAVSFCPFCGASVTPGTCRQCGDTIEPTWRFCGTCGHPAAG